MLDNAWVRCAVCSEPVNADNETAAVWLRMADGSSAVAHRVHLSEPGGEDLELAGEVGEVAFALDDVSFVDRVKDLAFATGGPVQALAELARDLEDCGPVEVQFHRDDAGKIDGFTLKGAT